MWQKNLDTCCSPMSYLHFAKKNLHPLIGWQDYLPCGFLKSHGTYGLELSAHAHVTGIT